MWTIKIFSRRPEKRTASGRYCRPWWGLPGDGVVNKPTTIMRRVRQRRFWAFGKREVVGPEGIEPSTIRLKVECSTAELQARRTLRTRKPGRSGADHRRRPWTGQAGKAMLDPGGELASFMAMRLTLTVTLLVPLVASACASQPMKTAERTTEQGVNEAAHAPFEDFNLVRSKIPKVLL